MGVNLETLLGHELDSPAVQALPQTLDVDRPLELAIATFTALSGRRYRQQGGLAWQRAGSERMRGIAPEHLWAEGEDVHLAGPAGFRLYVSRHACEVVHPTRWSVFLRQPRVRSALRPVFAELARLLGSPVAIYLPDSSFGPAGADDLVAEGQSIEQVVDWLRTNWGPPASTIGAIYQEIALGGWTGEGYFVDTFADLGMPTPS
jgi:hypothetical protein